MLSDTSYAPSIWDGNFYKATLAGTQVPDFILEIGGEITGRVLNEEGQGISNICPHLIGPANHTGTDPDGYFSLKSVPSGINYIRLFGNGIGPDGVKYSVGEAYKGPITVAAGQTVDVGTFTVYRAAMLTGIVTDQDGNPVMGAEVDLNGYDINGNLAGKNPVFTDAFGQYTIDFIAPGVFTIDFPKPGFLPNKIIGVNVISGRPIHDIDVALKSADNGASVSGKILNYEDVVPYDSNNIRYPSYVTASLDPLGDYGYGLVAVSMDRNYTEGDYLNPDQFSGRGIDQEDIEDGYADFFEEDPNENPGTYTMSVPNGDIAIGMYVLYEEYGPVTPGCLIFHGWKRFIFSKGDVRQDINFKATTTQTGTLRGDIRVPQGYVYFPENWCWIYAINKNNQTIIPLGDAIAFPGRALTFEFINMPEGVYTLNAYARNLASVSYASVEVIAGQTTTKDIVFTSGGSLTGQVSCDTNAIVCAVVAIEEIGRQTATDTSGNYTIQGINPGTYTVKVTATGYADAEAAVSISAGSTINKDFTLNTNVGSIAGTVKDGDGNNINGAELVAYNKADQLYRSTETVGGAFSITQLTPGQYILAVDTPEHGVVVYPFEITLAADQGITGIAITVGEVQPPAFTLTSSASDDTPVVLSIEFYSDKDLNDDPSVSIVEGNGSIGSLISNPPKNRFEADYISDSSDTIVKIKIEETDPLLIGNPGSRTFTFELGSNLVQTSSTNVMNAIGGGASIMGTQDLTKIYVPPFAIAGANDAQALTLTIKRYGNPGDKAEGTPDSTVSALYDFSFDEEGISVDVNHTFTVTMSFQLPDGMTQEEFESTFEIRYFDAGDQEWKTDGISNVRINWANSTIMFEVSHLTKFAAFVPSATPEQTPSGNGGGAGGCFITTISL